MRVLHLATECAPFAKVGGLGDVVGALPKYLAAEGVEAAVWLPHYGSLGGGLALPGGAPEVVHHGTVEIGDRAFPYRVLEVRAPSFTLYLFEEPEHFGGPEVYTESETEAELEREAERYFVFQRGALDWLLARHEAGEPPFDVLHAHDHHAALAPVLLREDPLYAPLAEMATVLTVHSAEHQGVYPWRAWERMRVRAEPYDALLEEDELNSLKAGLHWADAVTTVSPTYADELVRDNRVALGLAESFRAARGKLTGILSGIDPAIWHPGHDAHLYEPFDRSDLAGKEAHKRQLCADLGLPPGPPLLAFVGRLMPEKGVEILPETLERLATRHDVSLVVLGTGRPEHEARLRGLSAALRGTGAAGRLVVRIAHDEPLAHRIYGAADLLLLPSRVEPGALAQLYGMAYGAIPVAHATGGLCDTVTEWDAEAGTGTGFLFEAFTSTAFYEATLRALAAFADPDARARLRRNGMGEDHAWGRPAAEYARLYRSLVRVAA